MDGTAKSATGVAAARDNRTGRRVTVNLPGGPLLIEWREADDHILMTGDTEIEFEGVLERETLTYSRTGPGDRPILEVVK